MASNFDGCLLRSGRRTSGAERSNPRPFRQLAWLFLIAALGMLHSTCAQGQTPDCFKLLVQSTQALREHNHEANIKITRARLTYCAAGLKADNEYGATLAELADGLIWVSQYAEALGVAERCLKIAQDSQIDCMYQKAQALFLTGRLEDAQNTLRHALAEPALTQHDLFAKDLVRKYFAQIKDISKQADETIHTLSLSYGTGFFVNTDGYLITNFHVVIGCQRVETLDGVRLKQIRSNAAADLALLHAEGPSRDQKASFRIAEPISGEPVVVFGFPLVGLLASSGNVTTGIVSATSGIGDNPINFQISAPVQPGNSGGPLLDKFGNVIGVVVAKLNAITVSEATGDIPQNVNFAIKASEVIALLDSAGVAPNIGMAREELKSEEIARRAKAFSTRLICARFQ